MAYNILIVDDSLPMRAVIKKVIKASGFDIGEVHEAGNGEEAMAVLDDQWLDLVITDYNMPGMNGMALLNAMKRNDLMKEIPVVMVTTEGSDARLAEFIDHGAVAYIRKPFTPEEIKLQLSRVMGEPQHERNDNDPSDEGLDF